MTRTRKKSQSDVTAKIWFLTWKGATQESELCDASYWNKLKEYGITCT